MGRRIAKQTIRLQTAAENTGKWKTYSIDLSKFFKADAGAIYRIELSYNKSYSLYNCDANSNVSNTENDEYEKRRMPHEFERRTIPIVSVSDKVDLLSSQIAHKEKKKEATFHQSTAQPFTSCTTKMSVLNDQLKCRAIYLAFLR
mgnify:CR=1 FL=1